MLSMVEWFMVLACVWVCNGYMHFHILFLVQKLMISESSGMHTSSILLCLCFKMNLLLKDSSSLHENTSKVGLPH